MRHLCLGLRTRTSEQLTHKVVLCTHISKHLTNKDFFGLDYPSWPNVNFCLHCRLYFASLYLQALCHGYYQQHYLQKHKPRSRH